MAFVAASVTGGLVIAHGGAAETPDFAFARAFVYDMIDLYASRMAAVFMVSASTLALRIGYVPRWIALLGYASALFLLLASMHVLLDNLCPTANTGVPAR